VAGAHGRMKQNTGLISCGTVCNRRRHLLMVCQATQ